MAFSINRNKSQLHSYNGSVNTLQIDSVNAAAPSSNSDLYDKLKNLIS